MRTCFTFGLLLELIRKLINVAPRLSKEPVDAILEALARIRLRFVAFLTLYNGLFRLTTCALARHRGEVVQSDSTVAGCVSGLSYALSPNYNIFNLGVAAVIQVGRISVTELRGGIWFCNDYVLECLELPRRKVRQSELAAAVQQTFLQFGRVGVPDELQHVRPGLLSLRHVEVCDEVHRYLFRFTVSILEMWDKLHCSQSSLLFRAQIAAECLGKVAMGFSWVAEMFVSWLFLNFVNYLWLW